MFILYFIKYICILLSLTCCEFALFRSGIYLMNDIWLSSTMEWLFGKRITPEEMLRKNQRALNKAMRDLDRERVRMEQQEKKIIADIKKMAKDGQMVIHDVCPIAYFILCSLVISFKWIVGRCENYG